MATRKQLETRAAALGAEVDFQDSFFNVDTPRGYVWASNGCSTISVQHHNNGGQSWRPEAYDEALGMMADGIEPAENPDDPDAGYWWSDELEG